MWLLIKRMMANEAAKHHNKANKVAKHKNDANEAATHKNIRKLIY